MQIARCAGVLRGIAFNELLGRSLEAFKLLGNYAQLQRNSVSYQEHRFCQNEGHEHRLIIKITLVYFTAIRLHLFRSLQLELSKDPPVTSS